MELYGTVSDWFAHRPRNSLRLFLTITYDQRINVLHEPIRTLHNISVEQLLLCIVALV